MLFYDPSVWYAIIDFFNYVSGVIERIPFVSVAIFGVLFASIVLSIPEK
jgi:hypothetical protein